MKFNALIPELTVSDIRTTQAFYLGVLGFTLEYERPEDKFCLLSLEGNQLMFEEMHEEGWNTGILEPPFGRGINFEMAVSDVEALYRRVLEHQIRPYRELKTSTYFAGGEAARQKEFLVQDPDGYLLRFVE